MKVYAMNVGAVDGDDEKWRKYLSPKRLRKVEKIKKKQNKAQSVCAELLLRRAVRDAAGVNANAAWDTDDNGKLYLTDYPDIRVNISHSGEYAVCAVHNADVGIDIQKCGEYNPSLAERFFTREETEYILNSHDSAEAFYEIWTKKESLLKASGKGITVPLSSFSVLDDEIEYDGRVYAFKEYRVKESGYKCFVCFASSPE